MSFADIQYLIDVTPFSAVNWKIGGFLEKDTLASPRVRQDYSDPDRIPAVGNQPARTP